MLCIFILPTHTLQLDSSAGHFYWTQLRQLLPMLIIVYVMHLSLTEFSLTPSDI